MNLNQDINISGLIIAVFNFIAAIFNLYFGFVIKKSQTDKEIIKGLREQLDIKTDLIKDQNEIATKREGAIDELMDKKNQYKRQYQTQLAENHILIGRLAAYENINRHEQLNSETANNLQKVQQ